MTPTIQEINVMVSIAIVEWYMPQKVFLNIVNESNMNLQKKLPKIWKILTNFRFSK